MNYKGKNIVFYDGYCVLCNTTARFILHFDKKQQFFLASLQSDETKKFLLQNQASILEKNSVIVFYDGKYYHSAEAVLLIFNVLGQPYRTLYRILKGIPLKYLEKIYQIVAKNRYRWFGQYDSCPILPEKFKARILN